MQLDLVDRRYGLGLGGEPLEMRDLEVRHADRAGSALALELLERFPGRDEVAVVESREGPVNEEQVHELEPEFRQCLRERAPRVSRRW